MRELTPRDPVHPPETAAADAPVPGHAAEGVPCADDEFRMLLEVMLEPAFRLAVRLGRDERDAEEVVREAARRAHRARRQFLRGVSFQAWFYRILLETCDVLDALGGAPARPAGRQAEALAALPEELRIPCALHAVDDLAYQDVADTLDAPRDAVRARLHAGRRLLLRELRRTAPAESPVPGSACADALGRLDDFLDLELDARTHAEVEAHVRGCESCAAVVRTERALLDETRRALRAVSLPAGLRGRVTRLLG